MTLLDRIPPNNQDAEKAVIGSILIDPDMLDDVAAVLRPGDFYAPLHGQMMEACTSLRRDHGAIDVLTLADRLNAEIIPAGDVRPLLAEIAISVPHAANAVYYANIVREKAERRRTLQALEDGLVKAHDTTEFISETIATINADLNAVETRTDRPTDSGTAIIETLTEIDKEAGDKERLSKIGIHAFDRQYGGIGGGELCILAARPGIGKTALAQLIAETIAANDGPVLFVSLEMSDSELTRRRLCSVGELDARHMRRGELTEQDQTNMRATADTLSGRPFHTWAADFPTVGDIEREARRLKQSEGLALLVVDYIGLLKADDMKARRHEQVAQISRDLKRTARRQGVPLLALCQLNRDADGAKPKLSHLRESGSIEQDADLVMFIHRAKGEDDDGDKTELIVAKNRHGAACEFKLKWVDRSASFADPYSQESNYFNE